MLNQKMWTITYDKRTPNARWMDGEQRTVNERKNGNIELLRDWIYLVLDNLMHFLYRSFHMSEKHALDILMFIVLISNCQKLQYPRLTLKEGGRCLDLM